MKKTNLTISYDEAKLSALKLYMAHKESTVEKALEKSLDILYLKTVPAGVREFIGMVSGNAAQSQNKSRTAKSSKQAESLSSAVGDKDMEVSGNGE